MLLFFDDERRLAQRLVTAGRITAARIRRHRFPDGERKLTLPPRLPRRVVILRSMHPPDDALVDLWFAARAARELGARHVTLLAPYLGYMRQDRAFSPGEVVSQRHVGAMLGTLFDAVIAVDPHLHRVRRLGDVMPGTSAATLSAAPLLGQYLRRRAAGALLLGPDEESAQWVRSAADAAGLEWAVARKVRRGDRRVTVSLPPLPVTGRRVVIVDDMVSTGRTLATAARLLYRAGARRVDVAAAHAVFAPGATEALAAAGIEAVWTTDSIAHPTNAVALTPLLADALRQRT